MQIDDKATSTGWVNPSLSTPWNAPTQSPNSSARPPTPRRWLDDFAAPSRPARYAPLVGALAAAFVFEPLGVGLGTFLAAVTGVIAVAAMVRPKSLDAWALLIAAVGFSLTFILRGSAILQFASALAVLLCLCGAAGLASYGGALRQHLGSAGMQFGELVVNLMTPGWWVISDARKRWAMRQSTHANATDTSDASLTGISPRSQRINTAIGLIVLVPILLVLGSLLAMAEPRFAALLSDVFDVDFEPLLRRILYLSLGATVLTAIICSGARKPVPVGREAVSGSARIGNVVLIGCGALFGLYGLSKFTTQKATLDAIRNTPGTTYSSVGREGFFALLAVAAIMMVVLLVIRTNARAGSHHELRLRLVLAEINVASVLLIVADSLQRLFWYRNEYGWTELRFYSVAAALLLGAWFLVIGVAFLSPFAHRRSMLPLNVLLALGAYGMVILINPVSFIAESNLRDMGRSLSSVAVSEQAGAYEASLGPDAWPAVAAAIQRGDLELGPRDQGADDATSLETGEYEASTVRSELCAGINEDWRSWNRSRSRGFSARNEVC